MLFHRYRLSSFRTENRKQKEHLPPSFFVTLMMRSFTIMPHLYTILRANTTDITIKAPMQCINAFKPWRRIRDTPHQSAYLLAFPLSTLYRGQDRGQNYYI